MAEESEWRCPICSDTRDGAAYVTPCLHQFCLGCIVRWTNRKASCPLCRQTVKSIIYSVRSEEDFLEMTFWQRPSRASVAGHQDEQRAANAVPVGGLLPRVWAGLFRDCRDILEPLMRWLRRQLRGRYRQRWWVVLLAQATIVSHLCHYGPDEKALVQKLQRFLRHQTVMFVQQLIAVVAERCRERFMQLLQPRDSQAAEEQEHSPAATPGPAAAPGDTPAPDPREQEEPREEQVVAGPSSAVQGRDCSPGGPRRPPKRRASCSQDSSDDKHPRRQ
ncbi:uncharacterized protein LOC141917201 [Strix aluco]|uniref:uncharacterized protein LOC141917201 n=1 Tax=Strix aluco TaxID=111821 RepID=UPI003DA3524D